MSKNFSDDFILLESLKRQDVHAYEYLYLASRNRLFVLADSIVRNEEVAKDIVQELFADFWSNRLYNNIKTSVKYYLYNAIRNRAIGYLRQEKYQVRMMEGLMALESNNDIYYPLENNELKIAINNAIAKLPKMARTVFQMHYVQQLTHHEIGQNLRITKSTVSSHIDRALKGLRAELRKTL